MFIYKKKRRHERQPIEKKNGCRSAAVATEIKIVSQWKLKEPFKVRTNRGLALVVYHPLGVGTLSKRPRAALSKASGSELCGHN